MMDSPDCNDCEHLKGRMTCSRPVDSHWNQATIQRRSHMNVSIDAERRSQRLLTRRRRCGPEGLFFEPKVLAGDVMARPAHSTVGDSDGDDGA